MLKTAQSATTRLTAKILFSMFDQPLLSFTERAAHERRIGKAVVAAG
jgi:CMP-2-keto-3-deoxyoctulosonic acid synthetase